MNKEILIAGFGGQGILFSGKFLAYEGLIDGKEVSWLPSYGPEMRGGTANCSIIISDSAVGSPIVSKPDILIAMNLPSLDKYENETKAGGQIFVDSSLSSGTNDALCAQNVFRSDTKRAVKYFLIRILVESKLNDTRTVTQVNKYKRAEVSLLLNPTHYANAFAYVNRVKLRAHISSFIIFSE